MIRIAISLLTLSGLGLIIPVLLLPHSPVQAQSGAASLLESKPSESDPNAPSETSNAEEIEAQQRATVAQLIKQGNNAYVNAEYEEAIAAYSQAIELYQRNAYAYYNRGNAYRKLKNNKAAFQDYTFALQLNPDNAYAHFYRGMLLTEVEDYDNALLDFSSALKLTDQNPVFFEERGDVYAQLDNEDAANADYKKAFDLYKTQGKERKVEFIRRKIIRTGG